MLPREHQAVWAGRAWSPSVILACLLAVVAVLVGVRQGQFTVGTALDLACCLAAGLSGRFPAAGGVAVLLLFGLSLADPQYPGIGAYAMLVPILSAVLNRRTVLVFALSAGSYALLLAMTWRRLTPQESLVDYALFWIAWLAGAWVVGVVLRRLMDAERSAARQRLVELRQDIARELHDTVAHDLSMISLSAERARLAGSASTADLDRMRAAADSALQDLRTMLALLRIEGGVVPPHGTISRLTLDSALVEAVERLRKDGFEPSVSIEGEPATLPHVASDTLAKVVREATSNIVRHGRRGSACSLLVDIRDHDAEVVVLNLPDQERRVVERRRERLGLSGLRERLAALGGEFSAGMGAERWILRARLPIIR